MKDRVSIKQILDLQEAGYDKSTGKLTITVIKPGFNSSKSRFYQKEALQRGHKLFEGAKMFVNHATAVEEKNRPEGDLNQWVGSVKRTWTQPDGTVMAEAAVIDPKFKAKLDALAENKLLSEMGVSIRAIGESRRGEIDGHKTDIVENFVAARSVDFVTYPGAGGRVEMMEADAQDANDVDMMTEAQLRDRRPDLVELVESKIKEGAQMKTVEQLTEELRVSEAKVQQLTIEKTAAETKATDLEKKVTEAENISKKAAAGVKLAELLKESKLPEASKTRLTARFKEALVVDGMAEAIKDEGEYVASLLGKKKVVTNLGEGHNRAAGEEPSEEDVKAIQESQVKSYMAMGLSEAEAKIAAAGK